MPIVDRQQDSDVTYEPVVASDVPKGRSKDSRAFLCAIVHSLIGGDKLAGLEELGRSSAHADVAHPQTRGSQVQQLLKVGLGSPSARQQRDCDSRGRNSQCDFTHDVLDIGQYQVDDKCYDRPSRRVQEEDLAMQLLDGCLDGLVGLALTFVQAHLIVGDELLQVCHIL